MSYEPIKYTFDGVGEFETVVNKMERKFTAAKETADAKVLCMVDDGDTWLQDYDRDPLVVYEDGDPVNAAAVSSNKSYYTPTQFHTPFRALEDALSTKEITPQGEITIGRYKKRLTSKITFDSVDIVDPTGNRINIGLKVDTAHNGFSAVKIDLGAERLVCENGLTAWDSQYTFRHEHNQGSFRDDIMIQTVEAIMTDTERIAERFEHAHDQHFRNLDEMYLQLLDCGIEWLFDEPMRALREAYEQEKSWHNNPEQMRQSPSLYDAYMVGTYAIDHLAKDDASEQAKKTCRERITNLIETYNGSTPDPSDMVSSTVEERTHRLTSSDGEEEWDGEYEIVQRVAAGI